MRILQLTSDWKWTGPAAPMLAARRRAARARVTRWRSRARPRRPRASRRCARARARPASRPRSSSSARAACARWRDRADARGCARCSRSARFDVVHTWHTRDHVLALRARARLRARGAHARRALVQARRADPGLALEPLAVRARQRRARVRLAGGRRARTARLRGGRPVAAVYGAVDLARFAPAPPDKAVRESLGLAPEHRVIGIVARAQRHRRFDLLLEATARLARRDAARAARGDRPRHAHRGDRGAARARGSASPIACVFAGYRTDDYADVLRCFDVFTFLVPGSDGGCRALLEAAACGIPAVTSRRGALPELVVDGAHRASLVDEQPERARGGVAGAARRPARRAGDGPRGARARGARVQPGSGSSARVDALYAAIS